LGLTQPQRHIAALEYFAAVRLTTFVKFTPSGGMVTGHAAMGDDGCISISIIDTGIGMTKPEIAMAFSPSGQVDSKIARAGEGTGLGLSISKSLMELHGGETGIASMPQKGTTMTIWFPAYRTARPAGARRAGRDRRRPKSSTSSWVRSYVYPGPGMAIEIDRA
jgi:hypothetical protein